MTTTCQLANLISYNPVALAAGTSLEEAMRIMDEEGVRHFPVLDDERRLVGVVSDRDVARALLARRARVAAFPESGMISCAIGDLVTRDPVTIQAEAGLRESLLLLLAHRLHSLPVLEDGRLVGILSSSDFLNEFAFGNLPGRDELVVDHLHADERGWIDAEASIEEARAAMQERGLEHLIVISDGTPIGSLSFGDLRRAAEHDGDLHGATSLEEIVAGHAGNVLSTAPLSTAARLMREHRTKAIPVVDVAGDTLGLITEDAILRLIARRLATAQPSNH